MEACLRDPEWEAWGGADLLALQDWVALSGHGETRRETWASDSPGFPSPFGLLRQLSLRPDRPPESLFPGEQAEGFRGAPAGSPRLLLFLLQQGLGVAELALDLLHPLVGILGGAVQLLLQEAQAHVGLAELLALDGGEERGAFGQGPQPLQAKAAAAAASAGLPPPSPSGRGAAKRTLILRDFFSSLMTVSRSSSLSPRPSASVISARRAAARSSTGGGGCKKSIDHCWLRAGDKLSNPERPTTSLSELQGSSEAGRQMQGGSPTLRRLSSGLPVPAASMGLTLVWGLSASYSPSCMAVAILFMVAMRMEQDWRRHS